ncbi:MAG: YegP family protein [Clostridia bacterium]|nr:YegP family protein [Clostridia bacterium]MBR6108259.1 YegP family protein [Clostridia bacterium]
MGKFIIKNTNTGIKFDLKANNGEVIATSEVYKAEASCRKGIASVIRNAPIAPVEDQTVEGFEKQKHPKFEVYTDKAGEFRFRLKARNGEIIATSEGYKSMPSCLNGIDSVKRNAVDSPIVKLED